MKKNKKLLTFDNDIHGMCEFGDMVIIPKVKDNIIPMKKTIIVDNKKKNGKDVGIF